MIEPVPEAEVPAVLERFRGHAESHQACEECGLYPLYFRDPEDEDGHVTRVDGCLGYLGQAINACCGHGGRKPAYVRIASTANGGHSIDICNGQVGDYADFFPKAEA